MEENKKQVYLSILLSGAALMGLSVLDKAGILSAALTIVGLTALLYSLRHAASRKAYALLAGIMALTFAVRFWGYTGSAGLDILLGLLIGLIMFALAGAERIFKKYEHQFWYTLVYPVIYLLFLYFTELLKINMPFRLDHYFSAFPDLCQITAVLGIYALDFSLAWTASVFAYVIDRKPKTTKIVSAAVYLAALCAVFCFGLWHESKMNMLENAKTDTVRVACVTGPYCGSYPDISDETLTMEQTVASLSGIVKDAAAEKTEILVFSEEAYTVTDSEETTFLDIAEQLAEANGMHILLAYEVEDTDGSESGKSINKLCWISDRGEVLYDYTKHCLVPFIEASECVRGDEMIEPFPIEVHGKTLNVAAAICYDADYELFMSHMGKDADLLLLPTWDWSAIAEEHFGVARLRAISSETTLVRSTYDGWNAVIDSTGNVIVRENTNDTGYGNVLVCDIPV